MQPLWLRTPLHDGEAANCANWRRQCLFRWPIRTERASRYLQQLCKHWSHGYTVKFDNFEGHIDFGKGQKVDMTAENKVLTMTVTNVSRETTIELAGVVTEHLKRFAFREDLDLSWSEPVG
ncbi:DUF2218 domain-containing protein [Mesorhizobium sp. M1329]|uniref:DUF2218 domain-containing protein n=1 Tax=Mesorhizobium sp. M1329 TaxID=2957083 RepID=UPI0033375C17